MRFWFDTEFIEDGRTIDMISIGVFSTRSPMMRFGQRRRCRNFQAQWSMTTNIF